jgi:hypothetical protein
MQIVAIKSKKRIRRSESVPMLCMVETTGFEPATSWSRTKRSTKLSHVSRLPFPANEFDYSTYQFKSEGAGLLSSSVTFGMYNYTLEALPFAMATLYLIAKHTVSC